MVFAVVTAAFGTLNDSCQSVGVSTFSEIDLRKLVSFDTEESPPLRKSGNSLSSSEVLNLFGKTKFLINLHFWSRVTVHLCCSNCMCNWTIH